MNEKSGWVNTLSIAIMLAICFFIITDIVYNERIWEFSDFALKARLLSIGMMIVVFYVASYMYRQISRYFINKNKDTKRGNWKEYAFIFLINFPFINIIHLFSIKYITQMHFRLRESLMVNIIGALLLFLYYIIIRNRILSENFIAQSLQLEKVKVDQLETELKFLKSQYHPHFLFNALNTIYFQVDENNKEAKQSIEQLSHLLRYQLYDIEQEKSDL